MNVQTVIADFFESNIYLLEKNGHKIMVDCGGPYDKVSAALREAQFVPEFVLLTHGHIDHILSLPSLEAKVFIHSDDAHYLSGAEYNLSVQLTGRPFEYNKKFYTYEDLPTELDIQVIHTPGHSPGSVCLLTEDCLFSGDTLFCGGIGNTAFPGGDYFTEMRSVEHLLCLPEHIKVFPGHGATTTIKQEKH